MSQLTPEQENSVEFWRGQYSKKLAECNKLVDDYWPLFRERDALKKENETLKIAATQARGEAALHLLESGHPMARFYAKKIRALHPLPPEACK